MCAEQREKERRQDAELLAKIQALIQSKERADENQATRGNYVAPARSSGNGQEIAESPCSGREDEAFSSSGQEVSSEVLEED